MVDTEGESASRPASTRRLRDRREDEELRQIDLEIFNSHPRQAVGESSFTIRFKSPDVEVISVTAANADGRTPDLGGRRLCARVEQEPVRPIAPLDVNAPASTCPAVVVDVPHLGRVMDRDVALLRLTYTGLQTEPTVVGAKRARIATDESVFDVAVAAAIVIGFVSMWVDVMARHRFSGLVLATAMVTVFFFALFRIWMPFRDRRTLFHPLWPQAPSVEQVRHLQFYNAMEPE